MYYILISLVNIVLRQFMMSLIHEYLKFSEKNIFQYMGLVVIHIDLYQHTTSSNTHLNVDSKVEVLEKYCRL